MRNSSIFVTGGTGNIGNRVISELVSQNFEVVALVRAATARLQCRTVVGDLSEIHLHQEAISRCDSIIHLASTRSNEPAEVLEEDYWGTLQLLSMWSRGAFVYSSTQTVYGVPRTTLDELTPYDPDNWYDLGNIFAEQTISMMSKRRAEGAGISLRLAVLWPSGARAKDRQFFDDVLSHCSRNGRFYVDSEEGLETYGTSFLGPKDMARAIVAATKVKVSGAYNVAGDFVTWRELVQTYNRLGGTSASIVVAGGKRVEGAMRLPCSRSVLDDAKFRAATGFVHQQDVATLIEERLEANQGE